MSTTEQNSAPQAEQTDASSNGSSNDSSKDSTTHFGYKTIEKDDKISMVAGVFHSVAAQYDVMNDLMSFGIHRLWKRFTIDASGVRPGNKVLDLAGGTGDLTAKFSKLVGREGNEGVALHPGGSHGFGVLR